MQLPRFFQGESLTRLLQGAFVGVVATLLIGFTWGGWMTGTTAKKLTNAAVEEAQVSLYSPVCVQRYIAKATPDQRAGFAKENAWNRDSFIEKTGFATPPGVSDPIAAVADKCAATLSNLLKAEKTDVPVKTN